MGSFLLSQLQDLNVGLYRNDGLAITNATPRDTENMKKEICRIFNNNGLRITIEANKQIINFLDVTFNLNRSTYQPFTKPNTSLQYVHRKSNHPPITTKNIPAGVNKRLLSLSSDKASFDQAAPPYQKALDESGYHYTLHYEPAKASKRKSRQCNNILCVTSLNVLRKGSLQTKLNAGLSEQQQEDLFQSERSFHEVKLLTTRTQ